MITKCSDCSVRVFMTCLFDHDYTQLEGGDFEKIFTEYIDISGIGETKELELMVAIHNIQTRITYIDAQVDIQKKFLHNFGIPFVNAFEDFKKYNHRLSWDPENPDKFVTQLQRVVVIEKKFHAELDTKVAELKKLKKDGVQPNSNGRRDFVRRLNNLGKEGYQIDKDKTNMEEVALMIRDQDAAINDKLKSE